MKTLELNVNCPKCKNKGVIQEKELEFKCKKCNWIFSLKELINKKSNKVRRIAELSKAGVITRLIPDVLGVSVSEMTDKQKNILKSCEKNDSCNSKLIEVLSESEIIEQKRIKLEKAHLTEREKQEKRARLQERRLLESIEQQKKKAEEIAKYRAEQQRNLMRYGYSSMQHEKSLKIRAEQERLYQERLEKEKELARRMMENKMKTSFEELTNAQKEFIRKYGVILGVPAEDLAPYVPCSVEACIMELSKYNIQEKSNYTVSEKEKAIDKMTLNKFI